MLRCLILRLIWVLCVCTAPIAMSSFGIPKLAFEHQSHTFSSCFVFLKVGGLPKLCNGTQSEGNVLSGAALIVSRAACCVCKHPPGHAVEGQEQHSADTWLVMHNVPLRNNQILAAYCSCLSLSVA